MDEEFNKVLKKHGVKYNQEVYASFGSTIVHGTVAGYGRNSNRLIVLLSEEDKERGWSEFSSCAEYIPGHKYGNKYWYIDEIVPNPSKTEEQKYDELLAGLGVHNGQRVKGSLGDEEVVVGKIVGYGHNTSYLVVLLEERGTYEGEEVRGWELDEKDAYLHSHKNKRNDLYWFINRIVEE